MDLCSLTYTSQPVGLLDDREVERILYRARVNNGLEGISGFLLFNGEAFIQVLEGTPTAIDDLMNRIRADPRHHHVAVVDRQALVERSFPDWTMGFLRLGGSVANAAAIDRALSRQTSDKTRALLFDMAGALSALR